MSFPAANICNLTHSAANISRHGEVHRKFTFKLICDTFGFSRFSARSWIIKVSHRRSASYPSLLSKVLANHYSLLSNLTNRLRRNLQTARRPRWQEKSGLPANSVFEWTTVGNTNICKAHRMKRREREKKMWAEAGVTSKALRMRCVCLLYAHFVVRACRRCLAFSWLSDEFKSFFVFFYDMSFVSFISHTAKIKV